MPKVVHSECVPRDGVPRDGVWSVVCGVMEMCGGMCVKEWCF